MNLYWSPRKWEKAPLMCRIFGHYWPDGWYGSEPYFTIKGGTVDGINEHHLYLYCKCWRCEETIHIANIHESAIKKVIRND